MDSTSGESIKLARGNNTSKSGGHGPLQARLTSSTHSDAEPSEEISHSHEEVPKHRTTTINPPSPERMAEDGLKEFSVPDQVEPIATASTSTALADNLRQLADSLLGVADTLDKLDTLFHLNGPITPKPHESTPTQISQLVKGRTDLQQMLRDYLFR